MVSALFREKLRPGQSPFYCRSIAETCAPGLVRQSGTSLIFSEPEGEPDSNLYSCEVSNLSEVTERPCAGLLARGQPQSGPWVFLSLLPPSWPCFSRGLPDRRDVLQLLRRCPVARALPGPPGRRTRFRATTTPGVGTLLGALAFAGYVLPDATLRGMRMSRSHGGTVPSDRWSSLTHRRHARP